MSEPPHAEAPKARVPLWLMATAAVAFLIFSLSLGFFAWWLVSRPPVQQPGRTTLAVPSAADAIPVEPGFVSVFNGRDLTGWEGDPDVWSVQDGAIRLQIPAAGDRKSVV